MRVRATITAPLSQSEEAAHSFLDPRVRAIMALDPALGPGYPAATLEVMTVPVGIVGFVQNDFLPFGHHAEHYARSIPGASLTRLTEGEGHFMYLDVCHDSRDAGGVPLFRDPESTAPRSMSVSD